jgi:predicted nucleic acid-binding protein
LVIFEIVFTLERSYKRPKAAIRRALLPLLELPGLVLPGKRRFRKAFDLYVNLNISFADACHAVLMQQLGLDEIATFDAEFDRVPGISRVKL